MIKLKGKDMQALQKRGAKAKNPRVDQAKPEPERAPAPAAPPPAPGGRELAHALSANKEMLERIQEAQHRANIQHATQMERLGAAIAELMKAKHTPRPWIFNIERDEKGRSRTISAEPVLDLDK